jgi:hypothetical protein
MIHGMSGVGKKVHFLEVGLVPALKEQKHLIGETECAPVV